MKLNPTRSDWFFPIEEVSVFASVTRNGAASDVRVPHKKALVAADTGDIVGIVGAGYKVFTNQQAVTLCHKFCLEAFPDTTPAEWTFVDGHGPGTRSWAAMDIHHRAHAMNLWGNGGGPSETFTPFVRITNSYNGSRALRIDVGFLREHCSNGVIFEQEAATLTVPHTRQGIHSLKVARPFAGMSALREEFSKTLAGVRVVAITPSEGRQLVRQVTGWPVLSDNPKPWERTEQEKLDADLETRLNGYFHELGENAYAAFNTMPTSPPARRKARASAATAPPSNAAPELGCGILTPAWPCPDSALPGICWSWHLRSRRPVTAGEIRPLKWLKCRNASLCPSRLSDFRLFSGSVSCPILASSSPRADRKCIHV